MPSSGGPPASSLPSSTVSATLPSAAFAQEAAEALGVGVRPSPLHGNGCFTLVRRERGLFRRRSGEAHVLPAVVELPHGTRDEVATVEEWEKDKELVVGTRRNKYWPIAMSTLCLDSMVLFEDRCVAWEELQADGFRLDSSYPVTFVVDASDPFMFANDLGDANNIAWIPHLRRSDEDPATLRRASFAVVATRDVREDEELGVAYGDAFWSDPTEKSPTIDGSLRRHPLVAQAVGDALARKFVATWNALTDSNGRELRDADLATLLHALRVPHQREAERALAGAHVAVHNDTTRLACDQALDRSTAYLESEVVEAFGTRRPVVEDGLLQFEPMLSWWDVHGHLYDDEDYEVDDAGEDEPPDDGDGSSDEEELLQDSDACDDASADEMEVDEMEVDPLVDTPEAHAIFAFVAGRVREDGDKRTAALTRGATILSGAIEAAEDAIDETNAPEAIEADTPEAAEDASEEAREPEAAEDVTEEAHEPEAAEDAPEAIEADAPEAAEDAHLRSSAPDVNRCGGGHEFGCGKSFCHRSMRLLGCDGCDVCFHKSCTKFRRYTTRMMQEVIAADVPFFCPRCDPDVSRADTSAPGIPRATIRLRGTHNHSSKHAVDCVKTDDAGARWVNTPDGWVPHTQSTAGYAESDDEA